VIVRDFLAAIALVFVIEGLLFAAAPGMTKKALASVLDTPDGTLRTVGLVSAILGVILVWIVRM
jgi:uncharacterized protein YjeT (DUF2065 family)